jgi:ornithine cyclodeaminase/alanine dehydrogenase-like protein (mu-crystallin family)
LPGGFARPFRQRGISSPIFLRAGIFIPLGRLHVKAPGADVVVTVTPARSPIIRNEWIGPGMHIAAVGADKKGDRELEGAILTRASIFVDDIRQCRTDGEINVPLSEGLITEADIAGESAK